MKPSFLSVGLLLAASSTPGCLEEPREFPDCTAPPPELDSVIVDVTVRRADYTSGVDALQVQQLDQLEVSYRTEQDGDFTLCELDACSMSWCSFDCRGDAGSLFEYEVRAAGHRTFSRLVLDDEWVVEDGCHEDEDCCTSLDYHASVDALLQAE